MLMLAVEDRGPTPMAGLSMQRATLRDHRSKGKHSFVEPIIVLHERATVICVQWSWRWVGICVSNAMFINV